jgi:hypothetical protein
MEVNLETHAISPLFDSLKIVSVQKDLKMARKQSMGIRTSSCDNLQL